MCLQADVLTVAQSSELREKMQEMEAQISGLLKQCGEESD